MAISPYAAMGAGGLMAGIGGLLTPDYSGAANQYQQSLNQLAQSYKPAEMAGRAGYGMTAALGAHQMMNPAALQNSLAQSYTNSPYQNQILQNTSNQMSMNAANTGMLGSTAQQAALQTSLAGQQNQFQQQYVDRGTNQYNMGEQQLSQLGTGLGHQGFNALNTGNQLQAQGYMAQMQAAMMPTPTQNMLTDALGGAMSMAGHLM